MKTFCLRIDLESTKGIKEGLPKILNLLKKHKIKASFYLTMGGESGLFEILWHRKKLKGERCIKIFSTKEKIRILLLPKDFVKENQPILKRILEGGHELGIHGWKHRAWTRGLEKINEKKHLILAIKKYKKSFGKAPTSFAAPAFRTNRKVIDALNDFGIIAISDFPGEKPFKIKESKIMNIPITIKGEGNTPIIEWLVSKGFSDEQIFKYLKKEIKRKKLSVIYVHDLFECRKKIELLDKLFTYLKKEKIKTKTIEGIANEHITNK